jgi:hypothetical protein
MQPRRALMSTPAFDDDPHLCKRLENFAIEKFLAPQPLPEIPFLTIDCNIRLRASHIAEVPIKELKL